MSRRRKYTLTPEALASRRRNLQKARAAPRELRYRPTARRLAASRANLARAQAARRRPRAAARIRLNALKHGLWTALTDESLAPLGEARSAYRRHLALFERAYLPQDARERRIVRRLAEAVWRRLRAFRAQAQWEMERLHNLFDRAPVAKRLTAEETENRVWALLHVLHD